jgi:hypothetical protein
LTGGLPPQGGPNPVQPYKVAMSWPVPCGKVHAPPNAPAGAPTMNASALAAAHQRFGPARVKNVPPNASSYTVLQGLEKTVETKRQLIRSVKRKLAALSQKT